MDLSELERLENPAKVLKLSEAMRLGAMIRPQLTSGQYQAHGKSCAIGAAYEAMTGIYVEFGQPARIWKLEHTNARMAYIEAYGRPIQVHNDEGMTREIIAYRLEALGY